jgi:hypothetical protein
VRLAVLRTDFPVALAEGFEAVLATGFRVLRALAAVLPVVVFLALVLEAAFAGVRSPG